MSSIKAPFIAVMESPQTLFQGVIKYSLKTDYESSKAIVFDFKMEPSHLFLKVKAQLI